MTPVSYYERDSTTTTTPDFYYILSCVFFVLLLLCLHIIKGDLKPFNSSWIEIVPSPSSDSINDQSFFDATASAAGTGWISYYWTS